MENILYLQIHSEETVTHISYIPVVTNRNVLVKQSLYFH